MGLNNFPLLEAVIDTASSGANTIIPAVANRELRIYELFLVLDGDSDLTFQDGATPLNGTLAMLANGAITLDFNGEKPWFTIAAGNAFVITLSAAVHLGGRVYYTQVAP